MRIIYSFIAALFLLITPFSVSAQYYWFIGGGEDGGWGSTEQPNWELMDPEMMFYDESTTSVWLSPERTLYALTGPITRNFSNETFRVDLWMADCSYEPDLIGVDIALFKGQWGVPPSENDIIGRSRGLVGGQLIIPGVGDKCSFMFSVDSLRLENERLGIQITTDGSCVAFFWNHQNAQSGLFRVSNDMKHYDFDLIGPAQGGSVSAVICGPQGSTHSDITTTHGDTVIDVAFNLACAINSNPDNREQHFYATPDVDRLTINGPFLNADDIMFNISDGGLRLRQAVIPVLTPYGVLVFTLLLIFGYLIIMKQQH